MNDKVIIFDKWKKSSNNGFYTREIYDSSWKIFPYAYCFRLFLIIFHYGVKTGHRNYKLDSWYFGFSHRKGKKIVDNWLKKNNFYTVDDPKIKLLI